MSSFTVSKASGKGSPLLFLSCANGHNIPHVVVEITRENADAEVLLERFTLTNCVVSAYDISGDGGGTPVEAISLNFTRIEFRQQFFNSDGTVQFQDDFWDLATNRGG
jgi:type VI secretion system secreted protein Hcp